MIKEIKSRINKPVFLISAVAGGILWFFCNYLYSTYRLKIAGFLMIPALCTFLFTVLFLIIWISSVVTGSFDKKNHLYTSIWGMLKYFSLSIVIIFFLSMLLEYLYELNPNQKITEPTSYIFVIDESASMSSNDPNGLRYNAISEIMNSPENTLPYMVYAFSSESRILRDMGYLTSNEEEIPINCDGATSIRETTLRILQDYKDKKWSGGKNPKIIFLTDGFATDLDNGFLWFKGNVPEFNTALEEYSKLGISISTVGLGSVDKDVILSFSTQGAIDAMVGKFSQGFSAVVRSRGILAVLQPNAISNLFATILNKQTGDYPQGDTTMEKSEFAHSLLLITVNRGYADEVMHEARKAGATGGTVIRSRLVGTEDAEKVYGAMLGEEREIITILTSDRNRDAIMETVNTSFGLRSPAQGLLCSLPVDKAYKL